MLIEIVKVNSSHTFNHPLLMKISENHKKSRFFLSILTKGTWLKKMKKLLVVQKLVIKYLQEYLFWNKKLTNKKIRNFIVYCKLTNNRLKNLILVIEITSKLLASATKLIKKILKIIQEVQNMFLKMSLKISKFKK